MNPLDVALVCPYDLSRPGGVQGQVIGLQQNLTALGHNAWVVGPDADDLAVPAVSVGSTVSIRANGSTTPISLEPSMVRRLRAAVAGASVVHVHEPLMPTVGWAALRGVRAPLVATFHADPPTWVRRGYRVLAPALRRAVGRAEVVTAVSEVAAGPVAAFTDVRIVPNGLDVTTLAARGSLTDPARHPKVAFLGRDDPRKGLDILLSAWQAVRSAVPDARLYVGGAHRPPIEGVTFLGRVDDEAKIELLTGAAVFVAPNRGGESFGLIVAEAMAAGCAVIASDLPGFRAVVAEAGVLVPTGLPGRFADAVIALLENPTEVQRLGGAGRERVRRFDWSMVAGAYLETYRDAIHGRA